MALLIEQPVISVARNRVDIVIFIFMIALASLIKMNLVRY